MSGPLGGGGWIFVSSDEFIYIERVCDSVSWRFLNAIITPYSYLFLISSDNSAC